LKMSSIDKTRKERKAVVTKEDIKKGLRELGLKQGDVAGVHSSLSSLGYAENGADTVIDALLEVVGEEGAVVVPTYSTNRIEFERTPEEIEMGLSWKFKVLPYDPRETPCWTGKIPDSFWRRKEAVRSSHPVFSLAAIGKKAEELCRGRDKLLEADGYILLIAVGLDRCTAMHLAEDRVQLPERILKKITPPAGLLEKYPEPEWETDFGPYPDFAKMEEISKKHGIMKITTIGEATIRLLKLRELIELYVEALRNNPDMFYGET